MNKDRKKREIRKFRGKRNNRQDQMEKGGVNTKTRSLYLTQQATANAKV